MVKLRAGRCVFLASREREYLLFLRFFPPSGLERCFILFARRRIGRGAVEGKGKI